MRLKHFYSRKFALVFAITLIVDTLRPLAAFALTSGPTQPEVQGFKTIEATNMVDLFTGDFNYNLPLFEIDGYPVNMSYNSNARVEDESSWVGLGWSLNPGAVNRDLRGLPDDFKGDVIEKKYNYKEDVTIGAGIGGSLEIFGIVGVGGGGGIFWNNKKGYGIEVKNNISLALANKIGGLNIGANSSFNSQNGIDFGLSLGLKKNIDRTTAGISASTNVNSRQGLKAINFGMTMKSSIVNTNKEGETTSSVGINGSASYSQDLGGATYFPTNPLPMTNTSFAFHGTLGGELFGFNGNITLDGYGTAQRLGLKNQSQNAFGYMYNAEGQKKATNLMDCNRDNQMVYREDMPNLPMSYGTYDNFSVSGQGVSGQYKLTKNDLGVFHSAYSINTSSSGTLGIELGAGNAIHGGGDGKATTVTNTSSAWIDNNQIRNVIPFTDDDKDYQGQYFKDASEKTVDDSIFLNKLGGTDPAYVKLTRNILTPMANRELITQRNKAQVGSNTISSTLKKSIRGKRYSTMSYLTNAEAAYTLDNGIKSYGVNTLTYSQSSCQAPATTSNVLAKDHHIREINITKADGSRYVFGIPAYNMKNEETSFSLNQNITRTEDKAFVGYSPGTENTINNSFGRDNFYESQNIPAYAHSYLLTGVLSDDYVDATNNGITDDDLGNAVKFNYNRKYNDFRWRTPFMKDTVRFLSGMKVDKLDDKGSYVYGEKEVWYMHSIESRNMVAQFYTSNRLDGYGVLDKDGGIGSQSLSKLDSVVIYSKSDLLKNGATAIPIKKVHFEYDYSSSPQTPNSTAINKGKLTLKKVYFTFGRNGKGKLNAYQFRYKQKIGVNDVAYNPTQIDRWGFYKQHPAGYPNYTEYPYSVQDATLANQAAGLWNIDTIYLPSGGRIAMQYESDDYAYVQNKRAGQMFFIKGFAKDTTVAGFVSGSNDAKSLYTTGSSIFGSPVVNNYIVVDVAAYSNLLNTAANPKNEAIKLLFEDVKDIYFKAKVQLTTDQTSMEYVTGYAAYDKNKIHYNGVTKNVFIPISSITDGGSTINPITLAAYQLMRFNLPELAYSLNGQTSAVNNPSKENAKKILMGIVTFMRDVSDLIKGFNKSRLQRQWSKLVDVNNQSWVRLANPTYKKLGGGSRVKTITVSDNWTVADGGGESNYTQSFSYTTTLNGKQISSGVAGYEPQLGGEENALKYPMPYKEKVKLAPDNTYYSEAPIGESFYPSPTVGYSEVRVESVYPNVKRSGTGYSINRFYTAKDFPTISDFTNIVAGTVKIKPPVLSSILKFNVVEQLGVSQGFVVETNNMHGIAKEEAVYNQQGALVSATNYYYKVDNANALTQHLNNDVQVINTNGTIETRKMGMETDVWTEMQDEQSNTSVGGINANLDGFLVAIFPIFVPVPLPVIQNEKKGLKTAITTKHIKRMGMLDKVVKTVDGSTLTTENVAYDIETGEVLLTKTENEFNDPLYNFSYPAHWAYDGMGPAYKNVGSILKGINFGSIGEIQGISTPTNFFAEGDELILQRESNQSYLTGTYYVARQSGNALAIYDQLGTPYNGTTQGNFTVKIKRSGRRNKPSMPIGSIASLLNPVISNTVSINSNTKVYQAEAKEYKNQWQMTCAVAPFVSDTNTFLSFTSQVINPYTKGILGNWRGWKNFVHFNQRNTATTPSIRNDGFIPTFSPYWTYNSGTKLWITNSSTNWVRSDSIHIYDGRGNEIESSDANNIPSAAYYGFNGTQVVAVVSNSTYKEMTYDSFEDYDFKNDCNNSIGYVNKNIRFYDSTKVSSKYKLNKDKSHTGNYSMEIGGNSQSSVNALLNNEFCFGGPCTDCLTSGDNSSLQTRSSVNRTITSNRTAANLIGTNSFGQFYNECTDCLPGFFPQGGKKYTMSVWVATDSSLVCNAKPRNINVSVNTVDFSGVGSVPVSLVPQGPVIDGWQKMEGTFTITNNLHLYAAIRFQNSNGLPCYIDDVRFLPFNAKMKAYAYDVRSRRLMAELDENHYATFYEYDDEGILVRIKRETETGVQTVKEARNYLKPNN
jgi:hypothetical protein